MNKKLLLVLASVLALRAQAQPTREWLAEYRGTYEYRPQYGGSLQLLPRDSTLVAIINDNEYPLRWVRRDVFLNGSGDTIPFRRDAAGALTGYSEQGIFYRRQSATTTALLEAVYARRLPNGTRPSYVYAPPRSTPDGLAVGSLADVGLATEQLTAMVQAVIEEQYPGLRSVLLWKSGKLVMEEYFYGYDQQRLQQLRSASKSFVSALVGAAIDRKLLGSEKDPVLPYFKYAAYANPDPRKQAWTVRDFLTMRTGLDCNDHDPQSAGNEEKMYPQADWVKFILDQPLQADPGTQGSYCSGGVAVLGKMVENVSGKTLPAFADQVLFQPLGIRHYQWNYHLDNSNPTVAQLYLTPRDMLKFGVLYAQRGRWNGQQVVPAAWVEKSLGKYSQLGSKKYGYFWWHQVFDVNGRQIEAQMATGNGGQKIYLLPTLDAVVVFTGSNYNSPRDTPPNELMPKYILPALLAGRKP